MKWKPFLFAPNNQAFTADGNYLFVGVDGDSQFSRMVFHNKLSNSTMLAAASTTGTARTAMQGS